MDDIQSRGHLLWKELASPSKEQSTIFSHERCRVTTLDGSLWPPTVQATVVGSSIRESKTRHTATGQVWKVLLWIEASRTPVTHMARRRNGIWQNDGLGDAFTRSPHLGERSKKTNLFSVPALPTFTALRPAAKSWSRMS